MKVEGGDVNMPVMAEQVGLVPDCPINIPNY